MITPNYKSRLAGGLVKLNVIELKQITVDRQPLSHLLERSRDDRRYQERDRPEVDIVTQLGC